MNLLFVSILINIANAIVHENNVLVLIESVSIRETHSLFLQSLKDRGYHLTLKYADDSSLNLKMFGEYVYQHVIIFAPSVREFGGQIDVRKLTEFVDDGGNVLVAGSPTIGEAIREFGSECGIEFDESNTIVFDHKNVDIMDNGNHNLLIVDPSHVANIPVITGNVTNPLLYRGISIASDNENPLIINILSASSSSYSYGINKELTDYPNTVGKNTQLVTGLQARNDARVLFVGSLEFFSDSFFISKPMHSETKQRYEQSGNQHLVNNLVRWTFKESGVLRVTAVHHHKVDEDVSKREYTIEDNVVYSIQIETKNDVGVWKPYIAEDVQLEFIRIDPFIRRTMPHKGNKYELQIKLPDVYGVFKFVVDYNRIGYTHLFSSTQVAVRPFTHTQYERFITSAYPYYASSLSMMVGVLLFSIVYLYFREDRKKTE